MLFLIAGAEEKNIADERSSNVEIVFLALH